MSVLLICRWKRTGRTALRRWHRIDVMVDRHPHAVQLTYETYVRDEGVALIDEAEGYEPVAF
ncbi:hypothetical protein [Streptomyces qinglanensis]|uniref:hypothetical protein n=1 Tax=Streptomyces qinglanensis TaxID=943816 RepID=UPI003D71DD4B